MVTFSLTAKIEFAASSAEGSARGCAVRRQHLGSTWSHSHTSWWCFGAWACWVKQIWVAHGFYHASSSQGLAFFRVRYCNSFALNYQSQARAWYYYAAKMLKPSLLVLFWVQIQTNLFLRFSNSSQAYCKYISTWTLKAEFNIMPAAYSDTRNIHALMASCR